ncbi:MAG: hypothetical protein ABI905_07990 [Betaproteobacteria bacterium]
MVSPSLIALAVVPLIVWRVYSRMRRLIGRQRSRLWRHWAALILCPLLVLLLGLGALFAPLGMVALVGGVAVGIGLGFWGLRLTRFERIGSDFFYTPNAHIGIALSLLLTARVGFRMFQVYALTSADSPASMQDFGRSPLTLVIVGMMMAYYATYAAGLLRWRRAAKQDGATPGA